MERNNWITTILNSANGIKSVEPNDDLFSKIQQRIQKENNVSSKTIWLVAASIAVLMLLNLSILITKTKERKTSSTAYLENTLNKSNQLYQ